MGREERRNYKIDGLIISFLTNDINDDEVKILLEWIDESDSNRSHFNDIRDAWMIAERTKSSKSFNVTDSYKKLSTLMAEKNPAGNLSSPARIFRWYHVAAVGLILFALGSLFTARFKNMKVMAEIAGDTTEIVVPLGSKTRMLLADGSEVWLNAGSSLRYGNNFNRLSREVFLSGEAFFSVVSDKSKPFTVSTSRLIVKAFGTKFNVKSYSDENSESAILVEGSIEVEVKGHGRKAENFRLKPNEKLVIRDEGAELTTMNQDKPEPVGKPSTRSLKVDFSSNVKTEYYTSWKDERWLIEREPLETLIPKLERRYNLKFRFADSELLKYKFTGTIQNETVDQIMEALRLTAPLKFKINRDSVILDVDNDLKDRYKRITTKR